MHWLTLIATLPAHPSALRVRIWRGLKATGAAALREGVYVLPDFAPTAGALRELERAVLDARAEAWLFELPAGDVAQEARLRALFDREAPCSELVREARAARRALGACTEAEARRQLRALDQQLAQLQAIDFFPGEPGQRAAAAVAALHVDFARRWGEGEPTATAARIARRDPASFQGCTWATRARPWVDRLATAWLVRRFVDRNPTFVWLTDARKCPRRAVGYDFDGATFSHVGDLVTFEVVARSFGLDAQPGIAALARLVHDIDVGGSASDEAAGLELLVRGLQARHGDDDALLEAALPLFDAAHAALQTP